MASKDRRIDQALAELDGQALTSVRVDPSNSRSLFEFDVGGLLQTWPYNRDGEQRLLYEPSGYVLVVRADGTYSHYPGDIPPDQEQWLPLPDTAPEPNREEATP
ncbi:MAG TPA: hypothetical protein VJL59_11235 [Anaerolineales bacterium]|nr:hypothetical protein [Anaerolineales bacterium]